MCLRVVVMEMYNDTIGVGLDVLGEGDGGDVGGRGEGVVWEILR